MDKTQNKRQHYIPQFIIKNFNFGEDNVNYWCIQENAWHDKWPSNVFMKEYMYSDEINHPDDIFYIEKALGEFESEISNLIKDKVLNKNEIVLTRAELEKLRIFLGLLSFRSNTRMNQYSNDLFDDKTRQLLLKYAPDGNFLNLWRKEIEIIAKSRSYKDINDNKMIDPIIKMDFQTLLSGYFMTIIDTKKEFIIGDVYPTCEIFPISMDGKTKIYMHYLFPISPTRMILLNFVFFKEEIMAKNNPMFSPFISFSQIKGNMIIPPTPCYIISNSQHSPKDTFTYIPQVISDKDVEYLNALMLNEAKIGIIYHDKNKIYDSVKNFNKRNDVKQNYNNFERFLGK